MRARTKTRISGMMKRTSSPTPSMYVELCTLILRYRGELKRRGDSY